MLLALFAGFYIMALFAESVTVMLDRILYHGAFGSECNSCWAGFYILALFAASVTVMLGIILCHGTFCSKCNCHVGQDSIGGSCHSVMITNVAPEESFYYDTYCTLNLATKSRKIINNNVASITLDRPAGDWWILGCALCALFASPFSP